MLLFTNRLYSSLRTPECKNCLIRATVKNIWAFEFLGNKIFNLTFLLKSAKILKGMRNSETDIREVKGWNALRIFIELLDQYFC
jgi:hypothetical protein